MASCRTGAPAKRLPIPCWKSTKALDCDNVSASPSVTAIWMKVTPSASRMSRTAGRIVGVQLSEHLLHDLLIFLGVVRLCLVPHNHDLVHDEPSTCSVAKCCR